MQIQKDLDSKKNTPSTEQINQGDCVHLRNNKDLYQVIGIDDVHQKCWIRRWPLLSQGSPVFEISLQQIALPSE